MCRVPPRQYCPAAVASLGLLLALLVCAPRAQAQRAPSREPTSGEYAREVQKQLKAADDSSDPQTRKLSRLFSGWALLAIAAVAIAPLVIAFKVGIWFLSKMTATTDPEKLALSDPWVRSHLAQQQRRGDAPPG